MGKADGVEIPGSMGKPLFRPAPVFIFAGYCKAIVKGDFVLVVESRRDAVADGAWCVGVLIRPKEHIGCIAVAAPHQHTGVEWVPAKDPVQLVPGIGAELRLKGRLICEQRNRASCRSSK